MNDMAEEVLITSKSLSVREGGRAAGCGFVRSLRRFAGSPGPTT